MSRKEGVELVRKGIAGVIREREELAKVHKREEDDRLRMKREVSVRLREIGVIDLFEAIRDEGIVKWSSEPVYETRVVTGAKTLVKVGDFTPAKVEVDDHGGASLAFDYYPEKGYYESGYSTVKVELSIRGNELRVLGRRRYFTSLEGDFGGVLQWTEAYDGRRMEYVDVGRFSLAEMIGRVVSDPKHWGGSDKRNEP